jgi:hypothetical protein
MGIADTRAGLAAGFPTWHIWRGLDGRHEMKDWYATRRRRPTAGEQDARLAEMLSAVDPASLYALLEQQGAVEDRLAPDGSAA